ncbi:flagellar brake protein [Salinimonas marina]|uniref:Flagellar brake protein n=1 Tax=Salinimonas marina TaxID=2785918 RepID=A0A7S9HBP9_9ALTE|nr:flagellar brake protein [Salinimonas marina]QPG04310.1 flagellar brake protein [Salinimonas marina]
MLSDSDIALLKALQPGTTVDVQITTPTAPKRLKTHYIGLDMDHAVLFSVPNNNKWGAVRDLLLTDNTLVVRYVLEGMQGKVIAFKVKILRFLQHPVPMLITSFPERIESQGLRVEERGQLGIAVAIVEDEKSLIPASIVDLTSKGCRLGVLVEQEHEPIEVNEMLTFRCKLDGKSVNIIALVKNYTQENRYLFYGLQFESGQQAVETMLQRYSLYHN